MKDFLIRLHCSSFLDSDNPNLIEKETYGTITINSVVPWFWVKARISGYFTRKWYSRAEREYNDHSKDFWHDWIGIAEKAPSKVAQPEELETWALLSTTYKCHRHDPYDLDDDSYLECSGRWVEDISEDGRVTIKVASVVEGNEAIWKTLECVHETEYFQLLLHL